MNILFYKLRILLNNTILFISAIYFLQYIPIEAQSREVKVGAISLEGTLNFSSPLSVKIDNVAPLMQAAGNLNLDLVVLPEAYFRGNNYLSGAQNLDNSIVLDSIKVWAKKNNINVVFHIYENESSNLYATAVIIDRNGDYVGKYRKVNLPPEEVNDITSGDSYSVFDLDFGKVGVLICWDSWFTDPAKILVEKGAELIIVPTWSNCPKNLETIAAENGVPVTYSVLKIPKSVTYENMPSSVFNELGEPVYEDHYVGANKIAVGAINLNNYKNLALSKNVNASQNIDAAANILDGIYSTERDAESGIQSSWEVNSLPQSIEIDLEDDYEIDQISIAQFDGEDYSYLIEGKESNNNYKELSDSVVKLETILEHGIAGSEIYSSRFEKTKVRFVRITIDSQVRSDVIINEVKVFGYVEPAEQNQSIYYVAPDGKATNLGTIDSPWSLDKVNKTLQSGETVILLDGTYTGTPIAPENTGEEGAYITYRAENKQMAIFQNIDGYTSDTRESNGSTVIFLDERAYVEVDGIKGLNVKRWVVGKKTNHITIKNCYFENGSGWINCRFDEIGDGMVIKDNYFTGGTDLVSLDGGEGHLVEGNFFGDASHTGLVLLGVKHSVVRNNTLTNRLWRNMEVESQRHEPYTHSEYNLIEKNNFGYTPSNIMQYAGNNSILRRNIFKRGNQGMGWANYLGSAKTPEAWHNEHNRFYNNVIAECGTNDIVIQIREENKANGISPAENTSTDGYGMTYATNLFNPSIPEYPDVAYGDNVVVNNIFYLNANTSASKSSETTQIAFIWNATPEFGRFYNNNLFSGILGSDVIFFLDGMYQTPVEPTNSSIAAFENTYPDWADGNIEIDPLFVDPKNGNYRLSDSSECIDVGKALTNVSSASQGTVIHVDDALYFTDGYGLIEPDTIRIGSYRVSVESVNYEQNIITISKEITCEVGDEVFLDYLGNGPDLGAYEYDSTFTTGIHNLDEQNLLNSYKLMQNYPNPFNPFTKIKYSIKNKSKVCIEIYDLLGKKIATLVDEYKTAGNYDVLWNAKNNKGQNISSGIYFYKLGLKENGSSISEIKKMVVLK